MAADTLETIRGVIADVCAIEPDAVREDAFLLAYDIDSLRTVDLLLALETAFDVEAPDTDPALRHVRTVRDLATYVDRLRGGDPG